jgi:hypothetical protein
MRNAVIALLLALGAHAAAAAETAAARQCSCDSLDVCTTVDGIPILFAKRDMVRAALRKNGLKPAEEDDARIRDSYVEPGAEFKTVEAFYDEERQLAALQFEYSLDKLDELLNGPPPAGIFVRKRGDFGADEDSSKTWLAEDGVEVKLHAFFLVRGCARRNFR